jgi:mannose/fructose/N-acetylgalactosamine-specific phosphotransferase system component IIC
MIENDRVRDEKFIYLFDGFLHKTPSEFIEFSVGQFGAELAWIHCQTDNKKIEERYKQAKEIEGDLPEDAVAELQEQAK